MDKKIRFGILSTAEIAHKVVSAIQESNNAVAYAVASRSLEKASSWAKEHNIDIAYGSYQELLDDKNVDAIYIPLPTSLKTEWAIKSAKAGKHILLEKPLPGVDSDEELQQIIKATQDNNVQFMDGTMWLHSIRTKQVREKINSGDLGQLVRVIASFTFKAPNEEWLNGGNGRTDSTREPMGCLGDQGWYPLGAIMFAFNYELPQKVQMNYVEYNKVNTIISCSGFLQFSGNRTAFFDCGVNASHRQQFEVVFSNGSLRIDDQVGGQGRSGNFNAYFENFKGSDYYKVDDVYGKESIVSTDSCNHTVKMIEDFSQLVIDNQISDDWPTRSLRCHQVMIRLLQSCKEGFKILDI